MGADGGGTKQQTDNHGKGADRRILSDREPDRMNSSSL